MEKDPHSDREFLMRLTKLVEAKLSDENFGVSELAENVGMSRSRLYFRVKSATQKTVSQLIREIRLSKAMKLLQLSNLTVSEVSYQVGFSSPAYFNRCFHDHYGYPPGEAKKHIENESDLDELAEERVKRRKSSGHYPKLIIAGITIFVLLGFYVGYRTYSNNSSKNTRNSVSKSIAVLPLKNLSNNPEIQYLADGVMEDILTRLSYIDGLVVKSRTSSEKMGGKNLTARELAKQMNVEYILEGSIIPESEKVRINVQLINAKEDQHVWANQVDKDLKEILPFITEVSSQITDQLEIILSPEEKVQLEKHYTESQEAYDLFLQGRYYYLLRTKEGEEKSIELYNQALALDSNFCLAYAGLADSYVSGSFDKFITKSEGIPKGKMNALKALSIEKNLAEPHATLGAIFTFFERDCDKAEREFKMALKINPGYARGYKLYAEFLSLAGRMDEARTNMNKTLELQPMYLRHIKVSQELYVREMKFDKARKEADRIYYMDQDETGYHFRKYYSYLLENRIPEAIEEFKKFRGSFSPEFNTGIIDSIYAKSGRDGFLRYVIKDGREALGIYGLSEYYTLDNEKDSAFYYLNKVANEFEKEYVYGIEHNPVFKNLRSDPRFDEILKEIY
ncbi:helix-turn-helix domain-containing protein [uncultured Draconibacterium sp.]|mgnify:CR=1 FL=1|uniref:helix-turn-helix domain-containing protein n=1 Tax=uncultured Draconibacterium sp. TaxID=1573823 RepID=UPI0025D65FDF|nr:helix-turn-helix domain-containing protein [uncultured Draconibacterium sp.]